VLAKPDAERSLSGTTGAKASDNDKLGMLERCPRPKAERMMQFVYGAVAVCGE